MQVLRVEAFLQPRVVLLDSVAMQRVIQEQGEVRVEIEQRPAQESTGFETVAGPEGLPIVHARSTQAYLSTVAWIDISKAGQLSRRDEIERNLAGGEKIIASEIQLHPDGFTVVELARVAAGQVVALVMQRTLKRSIGSLAIVREKGVGLVERGTVAKEASVTSERSTLQAQHDLVRQALFKPNVNDAETGKIAVFRTERPIENIHVLNQFRRQRLQCAQVTLTVALGALVLLNIVYKNLQASIGSTMIQVEAK